MNQTDLKKWKTMMQTQATIPSESAQNIWQQCSDYLSESSIDVADDFKQQAERVFSLSEFVARQCQRKPQQLVELISTERLQSSLSFQQMELALKNQIKDITTEQQLASVLRQFRNYQMLAIYWRDLLDLADVKETCQQVSTLADICIQHASQWLYQKLCTAMGQPLNDGQAQHLIVIGMGKLGGNELNVSSDIDLIFCYQQMGEISQQNMTVSHEKFFNVLGRQLIKLLDQVTAEGFVFRVDMRLRPYGDSGPLVMSYSAMEEYYQDQGRDWERFALIKARVITGSEAEQKQLEQLLKPFVFRRYIDYSVLESPRQMKNLINQELRRRNLINNIKLGPGGIREVEFIAQALQLIHGGREPELQCRSLFQSMPKLVELDLLSQDIVDELMDCYLFLRKVEHRLQAVKDQQTQELPSTDIEQLRLAEGLNYKNWITFREAVTQCMKKIHHHFSEQFQDKNEQQKQSDVAIVFYDIWQSFTSMDRHIESILEQAGFQEVEDIASQLTNFRESSAVRHMGPRGAKRLDQLMPAILQSIVEMQQQAVSLNRVLRLLSSISRRTAYLELLGENKGALKQMIQLCSVSVRIADQISDYPYVLDELINPDTLFHPPEISRFPFF